AKRCLCGSGKPLVHRAYRVVDRRNRSFGKHSAGTVSEPALDPGSHRHRTDVYQRGVYGLLPGGKCPALVRVHSDAWIEDTVALEPVFHADGQVVSGAAYLSSGGIQYFRGVDPDSEVEPVGDAVHYFCGRRDGVVRGDRVLRNGKRVVLVGSRTAIDAGHCAVRTVR